MSTSPGRARPRAPRAVALVVALVLGGGLGAAAGGAVPAAPGPGSAGIGDDYFPLDGNGGIDVLHYDVRDSYRFRDRSLSGSTRLRIRATQDLSRFNLDLLLPVRRVTVDGTVARHVKPNRHELQVTPPSPVPAGEVFRVRVDYAGFPERVGWDGERNWLAGPGEVVTMNEPHMAAWWFPANDHPLDKARMDIRVSVPKAKSVVANGHRVGRTVHGRRATVHWRAPEPMAPYLAFFAAGSFAVDTGVRDGLPWLVAVSKRVPEEQRARSMRLMRRTPGVVAWMETWLGDYPFSTTGGVTTSLDPGFALENQTRPTYPVLRSGGLRLVVHEQAHQWFGNSVSVAGWRDIWLNEGAATFMEAVYGETHGGRSADEWLRQTYAGWSAASSFWDLSIADPGPGHLFASPVYQRGGMAFQALRNRVGEEDFWALVRTWLTRHADGNGSTGDFTALAEEVSGEELDTFFRAWLREPAKPADTADNGLG